MNSKISLRLLGWQPFFQQQLSVEEFEYTTIARVIFHHRSEYVLHTGQDKVRLPVTPFLPKMVLGDWLLLDINKHFLRLLERKSLFKRKSSGTQIGEQYIVANVDTALIVCSLNADFNLNRIERYLALAHEAKVEPVVILTKQDLCHDDVEAKKMAVRQLDPLLIVESVNALDKESCQVLSDWCHQGRTLSFLGSSGVGKSTLINTLLGDEIQRTGQIREDDQKGRHTTTARTMHFMSTGAVLIDTPGMRELQMTGCQNGMSQTFSEIEHLAQRCRFSNCQHSGEPGCAVQKAIENGELESRRLTNYFKLLREQARNSASLKEQRAKHKQFGKMIRTMKSELNDRKKRF
ncbi:ribosome small subunit-dependent GTPase A [Vibrio salinus]|uniref:ribosome small subunit-dependent GTPase A n=1 Tax=Vibrio salinus TaxID=2899784 RepID=UPI001E41877D|nr:ribosome small subunit-dependent GTPase A [Vibrio salinus]MCE0495213.1 ribosome small subunit-dependent GTPase A [Vibrio salinus]